MRKLVGIAAAMSALSLLLIAGAAAPAMAATTSCGSFKVSVGGITVSDTGPLPGLAWLTLPWPGGTQSPYQYVSEVVVVSTSYLVLATASNYYDLPGFFALIMVANWSPIGGTVTVGVCFTT